LLFRLLVALLPQWDLLICAKYLFVPARDRAVGTQEAASPGRA